MNHPEGRIVAIVNDGGRRRALVDVDAAAICPRCAEGKGCGAGLFGGSGGSRRIEATLADNADVAEGDTVRLALAPRNILVAAAMVYGWPLAGAAAGAAMAYSGSFGDLAAAVSALAGLACGLALVRWRVRGSQCLEQFTPQVIV